MRIQFKTYNSPSRQRSPSPVKLSIRKPVPIFYSQTPKKTDGDGQRMKPRMTNVNGKITLQTRDI